MRLTQHERLTRLLKNSGLSINDRKLASYLINMGAFVPVCDIGDTVYFVIEDDATRTLQISAEEVVDVSKKGFYTSGHTGSRESGDLWLWNDLDEFVFLHKSQALRKISEKGEKL